MSFEKNALGWGAGPSALPLPADFEVVPPDVDPVDVPLGPAAGDVAPVLAVVDVEEARDELEHGTLEGACVDPVVAVYVRVAEIVGVKAEERPEGGVVDVLVQLVTEQLPRLLVEELPQRLKVLAHHRVGERLRRTEERQVGGRGLPFGGG